MFGEAEIWATERRSIAPPSVPLWRGLEPKPFALQLSSEDVIALFVEISSKTDINSNFACNKEIQPRLEKLSPLSLPSLCSRFLSSFSLSVEMSFPGC